MIAIETRYLPVTNTKPLRIVAETVNGQRFVMSADSASNQAGNTGRAEDNCRIVAQALADTMGWAGKLVCGATKRGYVFVFA